MLAQGRAVGSKIGAGKARVILEAKDMGQLQPGEARAAHTHSRPCCWSMCALSASAFWLLALCYVANLAK